MSPEPNNQNLGSWKVEDLMQTARSFAGLGADYNLPPEVRFLSNVAKLIQERNTVDKSASDPCVPATFLFAPVPPKDIAQLVTRIPMLNNGVTSLNGRIWLVSEAVNSGRRLEEMPQDDNDIFNIVTHSFGLSNVPAIIYEPRGLSPTIRFYPTGLQDPDKCEVLPAQGEKVTDELIFRVIDRVYEQCLITPDAQSRAGKLWEKAEVWWPSSKAEAVVQLNLKAGLAGQFLTCIIRDEQTTPAGRTDLEIEEKDPNQPGRIIRHALIELKVLRSFHEGGSVVPHSHNLEWIESGVLQANEYGTQKGALLATLCCFDMRTIDDKESCFEHVREKARLLRVVLRKWYIYSSSEHYRKAKAGK